MFTIIEEVPQVGLSDKKCCFCNKSDDYQERRHVVTIIGEADSIYICQQCLFELSGIVEQIRPDSFSNMITPENIQKFIDSLCKSADANNGEFTMVMPPFIGRSEAKKSFQNFNDINTIMKEQNKPSVSDYVAACLEGKRPDLYVVDDCSDIEDSQEPNIANPFFIEKNHQKRPGTE